MNVDLVKELEALYASSKPTNYDWIKETWSINFWEYAHLNITLIDWFYINMDTARDDKTGWPMFVEMLGLERAHIEHCVHYSGSLGPTRKAFQYLKEIEEKKDLKLGLVLEILKDLNRHDLLNPSFIHWKEGVANLDKSSEFSPNDCNEYIDMDNKSITISNTFSENSSMQQIGLVKSANVGEVGNTAGTFNNNSLSMEGKEKQSDKIKVIADKKTMKKTSKLAAKVLLVYSDDVKDEATRVAGYFRNPENGHGIIGVLMFREKRELWNTILADPCNTIHKWFKQVDFIVPILSPKFLKQIQNLDTSNDDDLKLNRFIYRLTLDEYVSIGSLNKRCRAIVPSHFASEVINHEVVYGNGLFSVTWQTTQLEELSSLIVNHI
ncbi:unnamed protein product [Meganyctiphanes norvegica]|uniref:Uncharacterized protein n=1 Tax=Meganyctiphanes norvegica TaxID=48144 RepID=A0AAV2SYC3_MEGNR